MSVFKLGLRAYFLFFSYLLLILVVQLIHIRSSLAYNSVNAQASEEEMFISNIKNDLDPSVNPSIFPTAVPTVTVYIPTQVPTLSTVAPTASEQPVTSGNGWIDVVNTYRSASGVSALSLNESVCGFAATRASEIASDFSHNGFISRRDSASLPYSGYSNVVENIAMTGNGQSAIDMWKGSASHNANLLADITHGCIVSSGNYVVFEGWKP
jgi:uncharacterized protein YkwD